MTVYLGAQGEIELKRVFDGGTLKSTINTADVNVANKRFSFDFEHGQLVTGDQVEITSTNGSALSFVDSYTDTSIKRFVHVDELDGIRLYDSFGNAVNGGTANAITLATPSGKIPVEVKVESSAPRVLAQVSNFEINTERETVDTTVLSDEFRTRVNTLISGSGRITAFWEYTGDQFQELPMYLYELAHRTRVGSNFSGNFYIKKSDYAPESISSRRRDDEVWWEVEGIITAAAIQFTPDSAVQITADFITTGEIQLRMKLETPDALLKEDSGDIRLDQDGSAKLLLQQDV